MLTLMSGTFLKLCINCSLASLSFGKEQTWNGHLPQQSQFQGRKGEDVLKTGDCPKEEGWMKDLALVCCGVLHSTPALHSPLFALLYLCKNSTEIDLFFPCHVVCCVTASVAVLCVG